jgi:hypothetical protein
VIDHNALRRIAQDLYVPVIHAKFGDQGTAALRTVLDLLTQLYERLEPELISQTLIVFHPLANFDEASLPASFVSVDDVIALADAIKTGATVRVLPRGFHVWAGGNIDPAIISKAAVVYAFTRGNERFVVDGSPHRVPVLDTTQASIFARPTFGSLREALKSYWQRVRTSSCPLFTAAWADGNRIFFKSRAEEEMRRSLHHFLSIVLRDVAEVRPEQNVSETEPVDIKVTWMFTTRLALIEIKWLGKSLVNGRITADHNSSRANEGAKQLADYLDSNKGGAPAHSTRGYLVVMDGRRWGLNKSSRSVSRKNGMHYENLEVTYHPAFHTVRNDFEEPVRLFCEPICDAS